MIGLIILAAVSGAASLASATGMTTKVIQEDIQAKKAAKASQTTPPRHQEPVATAMATDTTYVAPVEDDEEEEGGLSITSRTFAEKLFKLDATMQSYYDELNNAFVCYRKVSDRISKKCVSYRNKGKLLAKVTVRGKTIKLHLALNINDYPQSVYFQKDMSEYKSYAQTPFTVKIKSDRGLKRALALVDEVCTKAGTDKKTRFERVDSLAELKEFLPAEATEETK